MSGPNPTVVAILEKALADARSGRTIAIAFAQIGRFDAHEGESEWLTYYAWPDGEIAVGEKLQRAIAFSFSEVGSALTVERLQALAAAGGVS